MIGLVLALLLAGTTAPPPVVASVRVEADPEDVARLARYLEIAPGEPLDPEAVRHVVELFYATGEYADVVVEATAGDGGVDVVFRPLRAPLLDEVRIHGDRAVKPEEARRITRLRPREPLWPARLEAAARDLERALSDRGYLEARVQATSLPVARGADAVFTVETRPLVRVASARVEGTPAARERLRGRIRPRPGDPFRREKAEAAAEAMRQQLSREGYWQASVALEEAYDTAAARVGLVFRVDRGPRVEVEARGDEVGRVLGRVRELLREGGLRSDSLEEARDLLEEELRLRGHRLARVRHRQELEPSVLRVVYDVDAGEEARVAAMRIEGDETAGLAPLVTTQAGDPLVDSVVAEDARTLQRLLEERGHSAARVEAQVPEGAGVLPVVFRVQAGPLTRVVSVAVVSPRALPASSAPQELRLREGGPYRVSDLARDRDAVLAAYRNAGYMRAEVAPEVAFTDDRAGAEVVLRVSPGSPTTVDHVVIAGLETTQEEVVRRELALAEGEPLGLDRVLESQRRLAALGLFQRVTITEIDPDSELSRSVVVRAEEGPLTSVSYGIGYAEQDLLRGSVEVTRRNLFGMDRRLSAFARASFRGFRLLGTFREPYLLGRKQELFTTAFREEEDRDAFDFVRQGVTLQTARTLSRSWSLIVRQTYEETRTFNTTEDCLRLGREFCPGTLSGPSASLVHDTRDDPLDPRRGHFFLTDALVSLRLLGGNTLVKGFVQGATYQVLTARTLVALSGRVGAARTFGEEQLLVPKPDRFFAGGDYSLRGFGLDDVRPDGGNALLLGGVELRRHLAGPFWGAAFAETGNVYPLVSDVSLRDLRYTAGLGLRYKSALGPLRVDWGYKLDRRPGEKAYRLHFTIGHAF
ncbi:MAG TPA: POTRA domain-containing protein [Vicinamibacteria bacterium]|nr:POTRA domain-containing protein [Vicinamibacteria bacterium]